MISVLTRFVDRFHVGILRHIPLQTFRYLACGGLNFGVYIAVYAVSYNFVFAKRVVDLGVWGTAGHIALSPHIAALGIALPLNVLAGFWLQRNISFRLSPLRRGVQFSRYVATTIVLLVVTYCLTKLFVDGMGIFPTVAQAMIYTLTAVFGFAAQKHFTFRGARKD